jgi:hypothetical protein
MKKIILLIFLIGFTHAAFSQAYKPMLKENKTWVTQDWDGYVPWTGPWLYDCALWFLSGDSTVNGNTYYKLHSHDTTSFSGDPLLFPSSSNFTGILLREDSVERKIWGVQLPNDTIERIVYDFSLNIGDTMSSSNWQDAVFTSISTPPYIFYANYRKAIVDSIGIFILDNGENTKVFYLTPIDNISVSLSQAFYTNHDPFYVIEGIGSLNGFHYPFHNEFENSFDLECVSDNNISLYGIGSCGIILSVDKTEQSSIFKVFPNPNNGQNILISGKEISTIKIFNIQGQLLKEIETQHEETLVNLENQPKGIYLVNVQFKNGNVVTEKLVIQ